MTREHPSGVTDCLRRWRHGEPRSLESLLPLVYRELHRLATNQLRRERRNHTLGATELVHEAYLKLRGKQRPRWRDSEHFYAVASLLMRRLLVDHARRRNAIRRGGNWLRATLKSDSILDPGQAEEVLAVDDLLSSLSSFDYRKARVVELRFFWGMTIEETARVLGVAPVTVTREWRLARAWMTEALDAGGRPGGVASDAGDEAV